MTRTMLLAALLAAPITAQQTAYLIDSTVDQLFTVDLLTGNVTLIGSTLNNTLGTPADLCWRDDTNELFTIDLGTGSVGTLDVTTALYTPIWQTAITGWQAMAWDAKEHVFWLHNQNDILYRLDPATGLTTTVGALNPVTPLVTAMECDADGALYAIDFSSGAILSLDKATGVQTSGAITSPINMQGMAIAADGTWYAVNTTTDSLYRIDPFTGTTTLIGANPGTQFAKGLAIAGTAVQRGARGCPDGNNETRTMAWSGASNIGGMLQLGVTQGTVPTPVTLLIGFSATRASSIPLPLDLGPFGMPGCKLRTSPDTLFGPLVTGIQLPLPIPNLPGLVGFTLFSQGAVLDVGSPPANPVGLVFTDVAHIVVTR